MRITPKRFSFSICREDSPIWAIAAALPAGLALVAWIYHRQLLASGTLDPKEDSIVIPIWTDWGLAMLMTPIVLGVTLATLRENPTRSCLLAWEKQRPLRSTGATIFLGGGALIIAVGILFDVTGDLPWHAYLWDAYLSVWGAWFLFLRAALAAPAAT